MSNTLRVHLTTGDYVQIQMDDISGNDWVSLFNVVTDPEQALNVVDINGNRYLFPHKSILYLATD